MRSSITVLRAAVGGAFAGAVGTAAMDLVLYRRYRAGGGTDSFWDWEFAAGVEKWDQATAPGKVGQKLAQFLTRQELDDRWARTSTNVMHWATGIGWGLQYGVLASVAPSHPRLRAHALGPAAWLSGYVVLPLAGVYEPIWKYDAHTLGQDLSAHMVYGSVTSALFDVLSRAGNAHR